MRKILFRLLAIQGVATLAIAIGFYLASFNLAIPPLLAVGSVLYGGAIAAVVSLMLAWRVERARQPGTGVAGLYLSMLERMVFVAAAFVVAFLVLELVPLALLAGFVGAEVAYYLTAGLLRRRA